MSFNSRARVSGREPVTLVEIDLDKCANTYGISPCTAAIGITGPAQCYNTRSTCQDAAHYNLSSTTLQFCSRQQINATGYLPCVVSVNLAPAKMDPAGGLGQRASVSVTLQDFAYHDRLTDPYYKARAGTRSGTFFGRLIARNPFYLGRTMRIKTGYLNDDGSFDTADFISRTYLLTSIEGPDAKGIVTIKANDPLKLVDDGTAQAPLLSDGYLHADIADSATSLQLDPAGIGASEYPASGYVRVDSEVCSFTRSGDVLTITRAQYNTAAAAHSAGAKVQLCLRYASALIPDILYDLLHTRGNVPDAYCAFAQWQTEAFFNLTSTYSALITEPTGITALIKELCQSAGISIWWDERQSQIFIRALRTPSPTLVLDDDSHLIADSITVTDKPELRISESWVFMLQVDPTQNVDQVSNYRQGIVYADLDSESASEFGIAQIDKVYSRWITSRAVASATAQTRVQRFGLIPKEFTFALDAKDAMDYWTGDVAYINTRQVQDQNGDNANVAVVITQANEAVPGHRFEYVAQSFAVGNVATPATVITLTGNDVNLLSAYTALYGAPSGSTQVTFVVDNGTIIGQSSGAAALRTGVWPAGAIVVLENNGRIQAKGGNGAGYTGPSFVVSPAAIGGDAMLLESPIRIANYSQIWAGGGGGGIVKQFPLHTTTINAYAGGGGAGYTTAGVGGKGATLNTDSASYTSAFDGHDGTPTAGGRGGYSAAPTANASGGNPGEDGHNGASAGYYVKNNHFATWDVHGDERGHVV